MRDKRPTASVRGTGQRRDGQRRGSRDQGERYVSRHAQATSAGTIAGSSRKKVLLALLMAALTLTLGLTSASAAAPTITINAADGVSYTSAPLSGKVDTSDLETSWSFQVSTD